MSTSEVKQVWDRCVSIPLKDRQICLSRRLHNRKWRSHLSCSHDIRTMVSGPSCLRIITYPDCLCHPTGWPRRFYPSCRVPWAAPGWHPETFWLSHPGWRVLSDGVAWTPTTRTWRTTRWWSWRPRSCGNGSTSWSPRWSSPSQEGQSLGCLVFIHSFLVWLSFCHLCACLCVLKSEPTFETECEPTFPLLHKSNLGLYRVLYLGWTLITTSLLPSDLSDIKQTHKHRTKRLVH